MIAYKADDDPGDTALVDRHLFRWLGSWSCELALEWGYLKWTDDLAASGGRHAPHRNQQHGTFATTGDTTVDWTSPITTNQEVAIGMQVYIWLQAVFLVTLRT